MLHISWFLLVCQQDLSQQGIHDLGNGDSEKATDHTSFCGERETKRHGE